MEFVRAIGVDLIAFSFLGAARLGTFRLGGTHWCEWRNRAQPSATMGDRQQPTTTGNNRQQPRETESLQAAQIGARTAHQHTRDSVVSPLWASNNDNNDNNLVPVTVVEAVCLVVVVCCVGGE